MKLSERRYQATQLANSVRGLYIISQALYIASEEMDKVEGPHKELSNIADMRLLLEVFNIFPLTLKGGRDGESKREGSTVKVKNNEVNINGSKKDKKTA